MTTLDWHRQWIAHARAVWPRFSPAQRRRWIRAKRYAAQCAVHRIGSMYVDPRDQVFAQRTRGAA